MSIFKSTEECLAKFPHATESFFRRNVIGYTGSMSIYSASNEVAKMDTLKTRLTVGRQKDPVRSLKMAPRQPKAPKRARQKVARTRNLGTLTEAAFWGKVRSELRRAFRWWKPALEALKRQRIASKGPRGRKWLYRCEGCGKLYLRRQVQIDHKIPCGALTDYTHVGEFLKRLCCESPDDYAILCTEKCHLAKTNAERTAK